VLDDLIRAALKEAAMACTVPEELDQHVWNRIFQGSGPGSGGIADE